MNRTLLHKRIDSGNIRTAFNSDTDLAKREIVIGKIGDYYSLYVYDETNDRAVPVATTSGLTSEDILTILASDYYTTNDVYNKTEINGIVEEINNSVVGYHDALVIEINDLSEFVNTKAEEICDYVDTKVANLYDYIDSAITTESTQRDIIINSAITEVNEKIYELSAYTANFSDHQLLTEQAYYVLNEYGSVVVNDDGQIDDINGHRIYYSDKVYYCIYSDDSGGGGGDYDEETITEPDSGGVMTLNNSELSDDGYIVIGGVSVTSDGYIINNQVSPSRDSEYNPEISDGNIELDNIDTDDIQNGLMALSNTILDEENNILIIN